MTCQTCTAAGPVYTLTCLQCCARLVLSAHPLRAQAAGLLAAIARVPGAPGRAAILEAVRADRAKQILCQQE
jgi:hypothetical protein